MTSRRFITKRNLLSVQRAHRKYFSFHFDWIETPTSVTLPPPLSSIKWMRIKWPLSASRWPCRNTKICIHIDRNAREMLPNYVWKHFLSALHHIHPRTRQAMVEKKGQHRPSTYACSATSLAMARHFEMFSAEIKYLWATRCMAVWKHSVFVGDLCNYVEWSWETCQMRGSRTSEMSDSPPSDIEYVGSNPAQEKIAC